MTRDRPVVGVVAGLVLAAVGAVILGEQPLDGITALIAGGLFGLAVAEAVVSVGRTGDGYQAAACALLTELGMVWALYIETGHALDEAPPEAWVATIGGAALSAAWVRSAARRGRRSPET